MGEAVGARADVAIVTSDNPRTEEPEAIAEPVEEGVRARASRVSLRRRSRPRAKGYVVELDRQRAIALAIESARPGDVVLIAGKGHEDYQIVGTDEAAVRRSRRGAACARARRRERKPESR